jgi:hypothetical protein
MAAGSSVSIRSFRISGHGLGPLKGDDSVVGEGLHDAIRSINRKRNGSERCMGSELWRFWIQIKTEGIWENDTDNFQPIAKSVLNN